MLWRYKLREDAVTAKVIDMQKWDMDRLKAKATALTDAALRAMTDEQRDRFIRSLERHIQIKAE